MVTMEQTVSHYLRSDLWSYGTVNWDARALRFARTKCSLLGLPVTKESIPSAIHSSICEELDRLEEIILHLESRVRLTKTIARTDGCERHEMCVPYEDFKRYEEVRARLIRAVKMLPFNFPVFVQSCLVERQIQEATKR